MASCAACLREIAPGAKFALAGTEVFHRECAPNIAQSIGTRQKLEIIRLRSELAAERQESARLRTAISDVQQQAERRLDAAANDALNARDRRANESRQTRQKLQTITSLERDILIITKQRDDARQDAAAARTETALLKALSAPPGTQPEEHTKEDRDDAEQRFSLLELDPLE